MDNLISKAQEYLSLEKTLLHPEHLYKPVALYLETLLKWNKAYNLTAIDDIDALFTHHILDSFAILPWIRGNFILDVGTGAGLPGIPIAIAHPNLQVTLLDSNGKKIRFLQEVCRVLNLKNVKLEHARVEDYKSLQYFDTIISRAFSSLVDFTNKTSHLLEGSSNSIWLAMKGHNPLQELEELKYPYKVEFYTVPKLNAKRCCVIIDFLSK